ncbi:peroxidase family protein [Enterovirga aerilata]|uniref:Peroxidase n=1 Tax=Enterovirga aerilata TaxID=2730920 RepID=A0A849HX27_9HYPH|nr:heme peroxidase family protein [Enterovirga sp. DB1703]NNM71662.1 peroxidase [Enterovirga sp. DB1703]
MDVTKPVVTTPTLPKVHGRRPPRGLESTPSSPHALGRFGRMFRNLPVFEQDPADLVALADTMIDARGPDEPVDLPLGAADEDENTKIASGYTYLGQFIDHDITFDPVSSLQRQNDPDALEDFRTPRFDLDSIYARGPADQPYLYEADGLRFVLGETVSEDQLFAGPDLPRNQPSTGERRALIGDPRNDENLIVSQLHCTFLRFHNRMVDLVAEELRARRGDDTPAPAADIFKEAQRRVRWHYQWVVLWDFLPRVLGGRADGAGRDLVEEILAPADGSAGATPRLRFYDLHREPFIPVEFSVAAYRFGHSMVRPTYFFNDRVRGFTQDAHGRIQDPAQRLNTPIRTPIFSLDFGDPLAHMNGFRPLPGEWGFEWKYFFDMGATEAGLPQPSYRIDAVLAEPLRNLPDKVASGDSPFSLAERNLLRGRALGLPSGESVARAMGETPLSPDDLGIDQPSLRGNSPLWYYILKEAELEAGGEHLGPVGGRIVAETFIGLLWGDPLSFLRVEPAWTPELAVRGTFGMPELIAFAVPEQAPAVT